MGHAGQHQLLCPELQHAAIDRRRQGGLTRRIEHRPARQIQEINPGLEIHDGVGLAIIAQHKDVGPLTAGHLVTARAIQQDIVAKAPEQVIRPAVPRQQVIQTSAGQAVSLWGAGLHRP